MYVYIYMYVYTYLYIHIYIKGVKDILRALLVFWTIQARSFLLTQLQSSNRSAASVSTAERNVSMSNLTGDRHIDQNLVICTYLHIYRYIYVYIINMYTYIYICVYIYVYIYIHLYFNIFIHTYIYIRIYV